MKRWIAVGGVVLVAAAMMLPAGAHAQDFSVNVPSSLIRGPQGSTQPLLSADVPTEFVGATCSVLSTETANQPSVHQGNDITVSSGDDAVTVFGVEDSPGQVRAAEGTITLGTTVALSLTIGNSDASDNMPENFPPPPPIGTFSAGLRIDFDNCVSQTTTTESTTTSSSSSSSSSISSTTDPPNGQLRFDLLEPRCVDDFPFISYAVSGDVAPDARATVTITDANGSVVQVLDDQPLADDILWPGASVDPPDWPGWVLNFAGVWVIDPTDQVLRDDLTITVSVNPEVSGTVAYPEATTECADPSNLPANLVTVPFDPRPPTTVANLPVTGSDVQSEILVVAGALTAFGAVLLLVRRRPQID